MRQPADRRFCNAIVALEGIDPMHENGKLPEGVILLDSEQPEIELDADLALDLARLGASPLLVRAVGGEDAVRAAAAGNGAHP
jgi:hypothetical protein